MRPQRQPGAAAGAAPGEARTLGVLGARLYSILFRPCAVGEDMARSNSVCARCVACLDPNQHLHKTVTTAQVEARTLHVLAAWPAAAYLDIMQPRRMAQSALHFCHTRPAESISRSIGFEC